MARLRKLLLSAAFSAALIPATALAGGGWIDAGATGWNQPGAWVPGSPGADPAEMERCAAILRGPENGEEQSVQDSGWALYGAPAGGFGIHIASGLAAVDGDCRPLAFQDFVFVDGAFAGTISPELMDSGADGARAELYIASPDLMSARFERWDGSSIWMDFYIDRGAGPVLVAIPPVPATASPPPPPPSEPIVLPPAPEPATALVPAGPPVVSLDGADDRVEPNNRFKIEVLARSSVGVDKVSWWITGSDDPELSDVRERACDGDTECKESWRIRTLDSGVIQLHAKAVDKMGVSSVEVTKEIRVRPRDGRPTVIAVLSGEEVEAGERVNLELIAEDDEGVDKMSWFATETTDAELTAIHEENCDGDTRCSRMWRVRPSALGTITIHAKAKDKSGKDSDEFVEALIVRGKNAKPTVEVLMPAEEFSVGETIRIELVGKDDEGITRMWWWASDTDDAALEAEHEEACGGDKECRRTWRVTTTDSGRIKIHGKAIDGRKAESEEIVKIIRLTR